MVDVELSSVQRKLLDYGIHESVAAELDRIHLSGLYNSFSINQSNEICIAPPTNSGRRRLTIKTIKCVVKNYKN